jgi:hypothetical protein
MQTLEGSCHCGAVRYTVKSHTPQPYMRCYCSICRKTAGSGGYAINIMGQAKTLKVTGQSHLGIYRAIFDKDGKKVRGSSRRHFCKKCGSALYIFDPRWPQWIYPHASAIDTPLPAPAEVSHILLDSKESWVEVPTGKRHHRFDGFPEESIEDWHKARGLYEK